MPDRPLLSLEDLVTIRKLVDEHKKLIKPLPAWLTPTTQLRISGYDPQNGWMNLSECSYSDMGAVMPRGKDKDAKAAVIRDQLLEYGVKVD